MAGSSATRSISSTRSGCSRTRARARARRGAALRPAISMPWSASRPPASRRRASMPCWWGGSACRPDVRRLPVFGLGCAGGVIGLAARRRAWRAPPGPRMLFLVVELCALSFRKHDVSKSNLVATALFGDGAAARDLSSRGRWPGARRRRRAHLAELARHHGLGRGGGRAEGDLLARHPGAGRARYARRRERLPGARRARAPRHPPFRLPSRRRQGGDRARGGLRACPRARSTARAACCATMATCRRRRCCSCSTACCEPAPRAHAADGAGARLHRRHSCSSTCRDECGRRSPSALVAAQRLGELALWRAQHARAAAPRRGRARAIAIIPLS